MGNITMGPPEKFILQIKQTFQFDIFIETGTYLGSTAFIMSKYFKNIISIEANNKFYFDAKNKFQRNKNIEFLFGDSPAKLTEIIPTLKSPAIFWLDAHYSGGETYGKQSECPLLSEIKIINKSNLENIILIDDARLFLAPPPIPHDPSQWPNILQVLHELVINNNRYIFILDDVIFAVPEKIRSFSIQYCQTESSHQITNKSLLKILKFLKIK